MMNNTYIKIVWKTEDLDVPQEMYSEVSNNYELRKIEIYKNGNVFYATKEIENGTFLTEEEYPSFEAMTVDTNVEKITPSEISKKEFESLWLKYVANNLGDINI